MQDVLLLQSTMLCLATNDEKEQVILETTTYGAILTLVTKKAK